MMRQPATYGLLPLAVLLAVLWLCPLRSVAQPGSLAAERLLRYSQARPQEVAAIVTDRSCYLPGERIYLRVFLADEQTRRPLRSDNFLYVELIDSTSTVLRRVMLRPDSSRYSGYIDIPHEAGMGRCVLRAYTRQMTSQPTYECLKLIGLGYPPQSPLHLCEQPVAQMEEPLRCTLRREALYVEVGQVPVEAGRGLYLLGHCRMQPFLFQPTAGGQTYRIVRDSLPEGVSELMLVDDSLNVLVRRLFYSDHGAASRLRMGASVRRVSDSEVEVQLRSSRRMPDVDLAFSLTDTAAAPLTTLRSDLLLQADLSHPVPNLHRLSQVPAGLYCLGRFLAEEQWERYDVERALTDTATTVADELSASVPDTRLTVSGAVTSSASRQPKRQTRVSLISTQANFYDYTYTDDQGRFVFDSLLFADGTRLLIQADDEPASQAVISLDEPLFPPCTANPRSLWRADLAAAGYDWSHDDWFEGRQFRLADINVSGRRIRQALEHDPMAASADASFSQQFIEEIGATCLHELFRRIPGLRLDGENVYIRANTSIFGDNPATVAIDGVLMDRDFDLDELPMHDVARIDVFRTGSTVIWGARGGSGVVSITTKRGDYRPSSSAARAMKRVTPMGYQPALKSAAKAVWQPAVSLRSGSAVRLTMPLPEGQAATLTLSGLTIDGRVVEQVLRVE